MKTYNTFQELIEQAVIPLKRTQPNWARLDGKIGGEKGFIVFSYFLYKNKRWRINSDTRIEELMKAYKLIKKGIDPFISANTKSKTCLNLLPEYANFPYKYLYIYSV